MAERGLVPDFILNFFIQKISLARISSATNDNEKFTVINQLKSGPIAEKTTDTISIVHFPCTLEFNIKT